MLLNRIYERFVARRPQTRALAARARDRARRPVVIVPSILGTKLVDERGEIVWGSLARLYGGPPLARAVAPGELLGEFSLVDGVLAYDVFGGLVRFLELVGGYRRDLDLHVLAYDWRRGMPHAAGELAALADRLATEIDVVCVSTGGLAARYWFATTSTARVRKVIYVATPQRGSFHALWYLVDGVRPAPFGRTFPPPEVGELQTAWDSLPHPEDRVFVDRGGNELPHDHYDPEVWRRLGIGRGIADLEQRLADARAMWNVLDRGRTHPAAVAIGARNLPTIGRSVVEDGVARIPPCTPPRWRRSVPGIYEAGDSTVSVKSLRGTPGLVETVYVSSSSEHRLLPANREVHHRVLEALLANGERN